MAESSKRAVIVGIPGVGKSTVITRAADLLSQSAKTTTVVFGTLMFEEAKAKMGISHRDEMRAMPVQDQRRLQEMAAGRIADMKDDIVLVDTHLLINTGEGYYPGLPMRLLEIMRPTNIVMVSADPQEIVDRRRSDQTRQRDIISAETVGKELEMSRAMGAACSVITGSPFAIVMNSDGKVEEAAAHIAKMLIGSGR